MRDIRDDRDEEIFDERNWDPLRLALSSLTGPLQGVPVMGEALHKAIFAIGDEFAFDSSAIDLARPATAARDLVTGESFEDGFSDTLRDLESTMQGIGYFSDQAAAATSIMHMVRDLEGVASNLAGND